MVKNTGGNKSKKLASKSVNIINKTTRFASDSNELYAVVNKIMGGNICEVFCIDGINRMCIIRRKFSGKGRRNNWLSKGKWVLIGLREWETQNKEKNKCDLLEVYSDMDKEKLIKSSKEDFKPFVSIANDIENIGNDNIEFTNKSNENINENIHENIYQSNYDLEFDASDNDASDNDVCNNDASDNDVCDNDTCHNNASDNMSSIIKQVEWVNIDDI